MGEQLWERRDFSSLDNSYNLKYEICFLPKDRSTYQYVSLQLHRYSKNPMIAFVIRLNSHTAHDALVNTLKDKFQLDCRKDENTSEIRFYLNDVSKKETEEAFSLINTASPSSLSKDIFNKAFADILMKVIPAEKKVPWGTEYYTFENIVNDLRKELQSQIEQNPTMKVIVKLKHSLLTGMSCDVTDEEMTIKLTGKALKTSPQRMVTSQKKHTQTRPAEISSQESVVDNLAIHFPEPQAQQTSPVEKSLSSGPSVKSRKKVTLQHSFFTGMPCDVSDEAMARTLNNWKRS